MPVVKRDIWPEDYKVGNGQWVGELLISARAQGGSVEEDSRAKARLEGSKDAAAPIPPAQVSNTPMETLMSGPCANDFDFAYIQL